MRAVPIPVADFLKADLVVPGQVTEVGSVCLTALAVAHTPGTLGFLIEHNNRSIAYLPDTGQPPADIRWADRSECRCNTG